MNNVLIVSLDNWDSCAEVPYIFKKAGSEVDVFCRKGGWLQANRFHDKWIEAPLNTNLFFEKLLAIIDTGNYSFIVLTDEPSLKGLSERIIDEKLFAKVMPLLKMENKKMLSSKIGFSDFCIEKDIETPRYAIYHSETDIDPVLEKLRFPILNKNEFSWGGTDMRILATPLEVKELIKETAPTQPILFQEFIEGEEIRIDAFYYKGVLQAYFCAKVLTYAENRFTYNTRRTYYSNPEIKSHLINLGKKSGANGFANINYIYDNKENRYYLIEMDLRTNSWLAYSQYLSNNNFITTIKNLVENEALANPDSNLFKENIEIGLFYKDLKRVYWQNDVKGFFRWLLNIKGYWRFLPLHDLRLSKLIFKSLLNELLVSRLMKKFSKRK